mgnify:FL=1
MMSKSLNYAYPQRFEDGGEVQVTDLSGLKQEPLGNDMVLVKFQDGSYGKTQKALFQAAESLGAPMGSQKDFANWHLNEWAPKVASDPAFIAAHDKFNTDQISYNQAVMDSDPQYAQNRLAFVQTHAPNNAAAISAAEELVATGNYASATSPAAKASEQKSTSYAFVDADGNSYNMGDARPGHDGTSLERAIANVQEYYNLAPGSFTVSVPSEERLVGTYDSDSGSFQAATSDMRDINGFSAVPGMATTMAMGEEDAPFAEPTIEEIADRLGWVDSPTTMAVGEEDGGMPDTPGVDLMRPVPDAPVFSLPPGVDPMFPAPVTPSPVNPVFTPAPPPPVVNPVFTPSPDNTAFTPPPPPPVEGRTYGAYSGTPMGPTNSIQPFTPYMAPQQAQGPDLQSLITDTDYFLNNSAPRTSVFKRS